MDKAKLLKGYLPESDVELPSGEGTVRVRGLSREEAVAVQKGVRPDDPEADTILEVRALTAGMVDPTMTADEITQWRKVGVAADLQAVAKKISELSNLEKKSGKGPTSNSKRTQI